MMNPYAHHPAAPSSAMAIAPLDPDDYAILQEIALAQVAVLGRHEITTASGGSTQRALAALINGEHYAEKIRVYRLRAHDGLSWTYVQPYSGAVQLPGEHHFVLRGSLAAPVEVVPPASEWRRPRFVVMAAIGSLMLLFFYGVGLLLAALLVLLFPIYARFRSPDTITGKWLGSQPAVRGAVRGTKFGWLGLLGTGGWKLPWILQLYSVGNGISHLVCKAPDVGRLSMQRWRIGCGAAMNIARAVQSVLPNAAAPAQSPVAPPNYAAVTSS